MDCPDNKPMPEFLQQMYGVKTYNEARPISDMTLLISKLRTPSDITREGNNVQSFIQRMWENNLPNLTVQTLPAENVSLIKGLTHV